MNLISILLLFVCSLILQFSVNSFEINGFCGRPEKPFNSRLIPDKSQYNEGEEVRFQCNQYWNYLQKKRCIKGKWVGMQFRCGSTLAQNDLNYVKVEEISEDSVVLFDNNITLTTNYKFPNSFLSSRCQTKFQVESDKKIRWTLGIEKPISLPFFRITFQFINVSVEEALKIELTANASVSPYRTCKHTFQDSKKMWRFGTKVDINFECNANSATDYVEDIIGPSNQIIVETQTSIPIRYKLIMVLLAQPYGFADQPVCGEPEFKFGTVVRIMWPDVNYSISCSENMVYKSKDNPDLPDTTIHHQKCIHDMRWNGTFPECIPKTVCSIPEGLYNEVNPVYKINRIDNAFYFNQTQWYAIDGTTVHYQCNDPQNNILLGDAIHICKNGQWIGIEPNCFDITGLKNLKPKNKANDENNDNFDESDD